MAEDKKKSEEGSEAQESDSGQTSDSRNSAKKRIGIRDILRFLLGSYRPPGFISASFRAFKSGAVKRGLSSFFSTIGRFIARARVFFIIGAVVIAVVIAGGIGYGIWKSTQPQPIDVSFRVNPPRQNDYENNVYPPLTIDFRGSAAPLEEVGKAPSVLPELDPPVDGVWIWSRDNMLTFQPDEPWEIGQDYRFSLPPEMFPGHIKVDGRGLSFTTTGFNVRLTNSSFYIDPEDSSIKRVTAELSANYPVDPDSILGKVTISPDISADSGEIVRREYLPTITYSDDRTRVYIVSEALGMPSRDIQMYIRVDKGIKSLYGGKPSSQSLSSQVTVPGITSFVRVNSVGHDLVKNPQQQYEQIFTVKTKGKVDIDVLQQYLEVKLLPADRPELPGIPADEDHRWGSLEEIVPQVLTQSRNVDIEAIPNELQYSEVNSFRFDSIPGRYIYVRIKPGLNFYGGYYLADGFERIFRIQDYPREVEILSDGAILAYSGEKRLSILTRGLQYMDYSIGRVRPDDLNHLITQSNANLDNLRFNRSSFDEDNITQRYRGRIYTGSTDDPQDIAYSALEFSEYLNNIPRDGLRYGLFFVHLNGNYPYQRQGDSRFIMVTDLGFIVKRNSDGSRIVLVQSLATGNPVSGARVEVWGRNGTPIIQSYTNGTGYVEIPALDSYRNELAPTAFVVSKGEDRSFMPYSANGRGLDYSNFNIGGVRGAQDPEKLNAFLFSDRGIYRPGDGVNMGLIVKAGDWTRSIGGTPLEISVNDPQGTEIYNSQLSLSSSGFEEIQFSTMDYSPTGQYTVSVYLIQEDDKPKIFLGSNSIKVEEFLPDTLTLNTLFTPLPGKGWISPDDVAVKVNLRNLFGTPATGNSLRMEMTLSPGYQRFAGYPGYRFFDPLLKDKSFQQFLGDFTTDDNGEYQRSIDLSGFEAATYNLRVHTVAMEKGGGRSVEDEISVMVSPLKYIVGYKSDGSLQYIDRNAVRTVNFKAVDSQLNSVAESGLKLRIEEIRYVSVLVQQPNGLYRYQSVKKNYPYREDDFSISVSGSNISLPTGKGGEYIVSVIDGNDVVLNSFNYTVVGDENIERSLNRDAELELRLESSDLTPGDLATVFIKAPYAGAGYITVERDKVYAYKWFRMDGQSSVQTIMIPEELEGNGYINVTMVRDLASPEIYMSPLSYAAVPFTVSRERRTNDITLDIPEEARPGRAFPIKVSTARPAKTIVFAVDEGILQVAGYQTPRPLDFYFQKRALEVGSSQILDLLMPEYSLFQTRGAIGGGAGAEALARNLNPFKRRQNQPVVYWSGVIDTGPDPVSLEYEVPDYFNGSLRVMAVTVSADSLGSAEEEATIRSPYVIQPNSPMVLAPGDEAEVSVTVSNVNKGSGMDVPVTLNISTSEHLQVVGEHRFPLSIDEGGDKTVTFTVKALDRLGGAEISFTAAGADESAILSAYLSVRPSMPYHSELVAGRMGKGDEELDVLRNTYEEFAQRDVSLSYLPLGMAGGMVDYLERFPYACSEQLVSISFPKLFPDLLIGGEGGDVLRKDIGETIQILQSRQKSDGSFGMWTVRSPGADLIDIYAMHFLTLARQKGYYVPQTMYERGLRRLRELAGGNGAAYYQLDNRSYAVYVLTLNEVVTTSFIEDLMDDVKDMENWQDSFAGLFIAGSYAQLRLDNQAKGLISRIKRRIRWEKNQIYTDYLSYSSLYLYMLSKHFPDLLRSMDDELLDNIAGEMEDRRYSTFSLSFSLIGISEYMKNTPGESSGEFSVSQSDAEGLSSPVELSGERVFSGNFNSDTATLDVVNQSVLQLYYQAIHAGFERVIPEKSSNGIEITREYLNADGKPVTSAKIGDVLTVKLSFRTMDVDRLSNIAIVDLLPSGFEIDIPASRDSTAAAHPDYVDIREDRIVIFGGFSSQVKTIQYKVTAINKGKFIVPPAYAEAMYDPAVWAVNPQENFVIE